MTGPGDGGKEEAHRLWDALSDFDQSRPEAAVQWLMDVLAAREGMCNATWAGAIRVRDDDPGDPLRGWRVAATGALHPAALRSDEGHLAGVLDVWDRREIDPSFLLPLHNVGQFRTYSLRRGLPPAWFDTPFHARHYGAFGIHDVVFVAFPLNAVCETHFGFYADHPVAEGTIARLAYALRGIKWFHRQLMLSRGLLMASAPLTPGEHRMLPLLLGALPERRIARQLGLGESAAHAHVKAIFRKFGVRSRAGLISLWLSGPSGHPSPTD